ncbi:MAG: 3-isopropylmalate dehydratase, partial [Deltaproteobacteria bacterium]|nr:3-isopropylmalate dehydratase [Deltaproteobacteria bacterium]
RVNISGTRPKNVFAKDIILEITRQLTVNGATDCVVEYRGPVIDGMTMEERMTITNMAIESGGTSGICMPDMTTVEYLWEFIKEDYKNDKLTALDDFKKWWSDDDAVYEKIIDIDVSTLSPLSTVGYKPDQVKELKDLKDIKINQVYIGSCTNGRLSDLREAAKVAKGHKLAKGVRGIVAPATTKIYREAMKEGLLEILMEAGFMVTNATCGACLGMSNGVLAPGEVAASTTNRNFNGRMGKGGTVHLMSPASAVASGINGYLTDPNTITE